MNPGKFKTIFAIAAIAAIACLPYVAQSTTVYAIDLEYRLNGKGLDYDRLLDEIKVYYPGLNIVVLPIKRAHFSFNDDPEGCIFPSNREVMTSFKSTLIPIENLIDSEPIDTVGISLFSLFPKNNINKVGVINGMPEIHDIKVGDYDNFYVNDISSLLIMLFNDRINGAIGFYPDFLIASNKHGYDFKKVKEYRIYRDNVGFVCKNTVDNIAAMKSLNCAINKLHSTGRIHQILSPFASVVEVINEACR